MPGTRPGMTGYEMLTVIRLGLGLPDQLRRSLSCTNAIESLVAVLRRACRNVKRWCDARMMDGNGHAGGREELPPPEGSQTASLLRVALLRHQRTLGEQPIVSKNLAA
jgi:hypothetical protein